MGAVRRFLIWCAPLPLIAAPFLVVYLHEGGHREIGSLAAVVMAPCVVAHWMTGTVSAGATLVVGGVYWYFLGVLLLNSLFGRAGGVGRFLLMLMVAATVVMVSAALGMSGWNPG